MTDKDIADQIFAATKMSLVRYTKAADRGTQDERDRALVVEYLSGANQVATYLVCMDGEVTPQQMQRAIKMAGNRLGFELRSPHDPAE